MKLVWPKNKKIEYLVGIDEVGRGPLAGPVTVGIVAVHRSALETFKGFLKEISLRDSKQLSHERRVEIFKLMKQLQKEGTLIYKTGSRSALHIDRHGIAVCIRKIIAGLLTSTIQPAGISGEVHGTAHIRLDGALAAPAHFTFQETIIKGDEKDPLIALASIAAKVTRDAYMCHAARAYPLYDLEIHKGYGTRKHRAAIRRHGLSELHRKSFCRRLI